MFRTTEIPRALSALLLCALACLACGENRLRIESGRTGARVSMTGEIEDERLVYHFPEYRRGGRVRDLFNYIYFRGDTVCFSFELSRKIARPVIAVSFVDVQSGAEFEAERVEIYNKKIFGFSLVGSLLERFFSNRLDAAIPHDRYCCRPIPFELRFRVRERDGATLEQSLRGAFTIEYMR